jgi:hypothetical protein
MGLGLKIGARSKTRRTVGMSWTRSASRKSFVGMAANLGRIGHDPV